MKKYIIKYSFDGFGTVEVKAENEEKAEELFFEGEFEKEEEWGENSEIISINKK